MAIPVFSTRFLKATGIATPAYTVPPLKVIVIRQLTWVIALGSARCSASFTLPPGEAFVVGVSDANPTSYFQWQGRVVLNAGESFEMTCSSPAAMTASGYLLTA